MVDYTDAWLYEARATEATSLETALVIADQKYMFFPNSSGYGEL